MYHEITYAEIARRKRKRLVAVLLALVLAACIAVAVNVSSAIAREQATSSVRKAVVAAAVQCCAIEGSYPTSLSHLEAVYGLVVNHDDYLINYEWLGDNVPPSVVVKPR